jgi:hypothetical protein
MHCASIYYEPKQCIFLRESSTFGIVYTKYCGKSGLEFWKLEVTEFSTLFLLVNKNLTVSLFHVAPSLSVATRNKRDTGSPSATVS